MEPVFVIRDIEDRMIKKDQDGMLCIFDTMPQAVRFLRITPEKDSKECEILKRFVHFTE